MSVQPSVPACRFDGTVLKPTYWGAYNYWPNNNGKSIIWRLLLLFLHVQLMTGRRSFHREAFSGRSSSLKQAGTEASGGRAAAAAAASSQEGRNYSL